MHKLHVVVILSVICGCARQATAPQPDPVNSAAEGVAGIVAHTESAERHVRRALPHANTTGRLHLSAASEEHGEVLADASETRTALSAARQEASSLREGLADGELAYSRLQSRWYVRLGRWVERVLWFIGISWLVLGAASVIFGLGNPLSWTWRIGKEITRLLPVMNMFSWIRDWLLSRRKLEAKS